MTLAATAFLLLAMLPALAQGPITVLGQSTRDKFLSTFWSQQSNADVAIAGINANNTTRLADDTIALLLTSRSVSGAWYPTNTFTFQSWDTTAGALTTFNFDWDDGAPLNSNTVSRVGRVETLQYKTLQDAKFYDSTDYWTGVIYAQGSNVLKAIPAYTGTNYLYFGGGSSYITVIDGIISAFTGSTNITGTGLESLNGLTGANLRITTNSTGTDFNITATSTNVSVNLPTASATARGLLSMTDWSTFNSKQPGDATLTALAAFNQNGVIVQVGPNTFAGRTIIGTNGVIVINGDGVSGDIIIDSTNSPAAYLSAKGDLLSHDGTNLVQLTVGTDGQILSADSGEVSGLKWIDSPTPLTYSSLTTNYIPYYTMVGLSNSVLSNLGSLVAGIPGVFAEGVVYGYGFATTGQSASLTSDATTVDIIASRIQISSDSATASDRTFSLSTGYNTTSLAGYEILLVWTGTNAAELLSSDLNMDISADWKPTSDGHTLCLRWDNNVSKWREQWRYPFISASATLSTGAISAGSTNIWIFKGVAIGASTNITVSVNGTDYTFQAW